jgi:hypothetical protein
LGRKFKPNIETARLGLPKAAAAGVMAPITGVPTMLMLKKEELSGLMPELVTTKFTVAAWLTVAAGSVAVILEAV